MSDLKSKIPDMNEIGSMVGKLFKDVKSSVMEIIDDYKKKHEETAEPAAKAEAVKKPAAKESAAKKDVKSEAKETKTDAQE